MRLLPPLEHHPAGTVLDLRDPALRLLLDRLYGPGWALLQAGDTLASVRPITADRRRLSLETMAAELARPGPHHHGGSAP